MADSRAAIDAAKVAARPSKRSFSLSGHQTSISLEAAFWEGLKEIAAEKKMPISALVASIDKARGDAGLSGAVRVFVLAHYRERSETARAAGQD